MVMTSSPSLALDALAPLPYLQRFRCSKQLSMHCLLLLISTSVIALNYGAGVSTKG